MMEKMKKSAEDITMPDDVRKRIIEKCSEIEKNEKSGTGDYTDHVFTVERAEPKRIRRRIISGIAACAVLAGGIGATGVMLRRNNSPSIGSELSGEAEPAESVFGDFNSREYNFTYMDENLECSEYDASAELSGYLNKFDWGDEVNAPSPEEEENFSGRRYVASWYEDEYYFEVEVRDNGTVIYRKDDYNIENAFDSNKMLTIYFKKYFSIDFDRFESGLRDILDITEETTKSKTEYFEDFYQLYEAMTQMLTSPVNDENITAVLTYRSETVSGDGTVQMSDERYDDMTDAMIFGLASWISANRSPVVEPADGNVLFEVSINNPDTTIASFVFYEEDFFTYKSESEDLFCFRCDSRAALGYIESARDTSQKHTEDNAAYYLPGFNFVKLDVTGDEAANVQLQDIFYGYDWAALEVQDEDIYALSRKGNTSFCRTVIEDGETIRRNLVITDNGYVYLYDNRFEDCTSVDDPFEIQGEPFNIHVYKMPDTRIKDELEFYHRTETNYFDSYSYSESSMLDSLTVECIVSGSDEASVLTDQQKNDLWYVFEKYDWTDMKMSEKDQSVCGDIKYYIHCYDENDGNNMQFTMSITDKDYIILDNLDNVQKFKDFFNNDNPFTIYDATNNCLIGSIEDVLSLK